MHRTWHCIILTQYKSPVIAQLINTDGVVGRYFTATQCSINHVTYHQNPDIDQETKWFYTDECSASVS